MSLTAQGRINGTGGTRFIATFFLPDADWQVNFAGSFSSPVKAFSSAKATLKYNSANQINSTRQFDGELGKERIKLSTSNGPIIEAVLDVPVDVAINVSGSGVWVTL